MLFHVLDTVGNMNLSDGRCFLSVEEHNEPPLFSSERLMGAVGPRDSTTGGGSLSRQPGLRQHPALHAQPRTPGEPLSVPLPQPRLLHRHGVQQPALHPPLPGGRSLSLLNHQQQLPSPLRLLLLPFLHEQPRQWPGVQDGDRGGVWQPHQPPSKWGGSLLLGERGRGKLVVFLRDQKGVLRWRFDETFEAERMESVTLPLLTLASWAQQLALDTAERVCSQWPTVWVWQTKICMFHPRQMENSNFFVWIWMLDDFLIYEHLSLPLWLRNTWCVSEGCKCFGIFVQRLFTSCPYLQEVVSFVFV